MCGSSRPHVTNRQPSGGTKSWELQFIKALKFIRTSACVSCAIFHVPLLQHRPEPHYQPLIATKRMVQSPVFPTSSLSRQHSIHLFSYPCSVHATSSMRTLYFYSRLGKPQRNDAAQCINGMINGRQCPEQTLTRQEREGSGWVCRGWATRQAAGLASMQLAKCWPGELVDGLQEML